MRRKGKKFTGLRYFYILIFKLVNPPHFPQGRKDNIISILVFYSTVYEMHTIK